MPNSWPAVPAAAVAPTPGSWPGRPGRAGRRPTPRRPRGRGARRVELGGEPGVDAGRVDLGERARGWGRTWCDAAGGRRGLLVSRIVGTVTGGAGRRLAGGGEDSVGPGPTSAEIRRTGRAGVALVAVGEAPRVGRRVCPPRRRGGLGAPPVASTAAPGGDARRHGGRRPETGDAGDDRSSPAAGGPAAPPSGGRRRAGHPADGPGSAVGRVGCRASARAARPARARRLGRARTP